MIWTSICLVAVMGRSGGRLEFGQAFEQRVDPRARRGEPRLERVALLREGLDLLRQQRVGALQLLVTHEQPLDAFGNLVDLGGGGHRVAIVGLAFPVAPKITTLVLAVWFACRSSTGSRKLRSAAHASRRARGSP